MSIESYDIQEQFNFIYKEIMARLNHFDINDKVEKLVMYANLEVYIAGGCIRSILSKNELFKDLDIFVNGDNEYVENAIKNVFVDGILIRGPFGAYRWYPSNTCDFYCDIVKFSDFVVADHRIDTVEDLISNFDMSINAIAIDCRQKKNN